MINFNKFIRLFLIEGCFIILMVCCSTFTLTAQPVNWSLRYYTTEDGLSSNIIYCIHKDSKGMIWIGTENGLNRFDGYSFSQLEYESGEQHALSGIKVLSIFEDKENLLWIGTSNGLYSYEPSEPVSQVKHYPYNNSETNYSNHLPQPVNRICEDKNGLLWMNCEDIDDGLFLGLRTFNKRTETFTLKTIDSTFQIDSMTSSSGAYVPDIFCDKAGDLWFGSSAGLCKYDYENDSFKKYIPYPDDDFPQKNLIAYLFEDSHGNFWTSGVYGLLEFDREKEKFGQPIVLHSELGLYKEQSMAYAMKEDENGFLWMRINTGLFKVLPEPGNEKKLMVQEKWIPEIKQMSINLLTVLLVENPMSIWTALYGRGLCHISIQRNNFRSILPSSSYKQTAYFRDYITGVYCDSLNRYWISTPENAAIEYNRSGQLVKYHEFYQNNLINGIDMDSNGQMWFLSRYGIHTKTRVNERGDLDYVTYYPEMNSPSSLTARYELNAFGIGTVAPNLREHLAFKDWDGRLWFNSGKRIHDRFEPEVNGFIHLKHQKIDYFNNDTCIAEKEGEIWFPSEHGLLRIIPPLTEITPNTFIPERTVLYNNIQGDNTSLNSNWIKSIYISKVFEPGTMWIATIGGGLNKMIRKQIEGTEKFNILFEHFTKTEGLCDNNIMGILEDESGNLWLSTMNGLSKFDPRTGIFNNFYEKDGLPANLFTWAEPCKSPSGEMIFPTEKGVLLFYPDSIQINEEVPAVLITDFRIFNKQVFPGPASPIKQDIRYAEEIELAYNQNFISIEFASLNFEQSERNQYKYKMEGVDREWIYSGTRRFAEYTALKPGTYTFRVLGSNNNGIWNEEGRSLRISINGPPWFSWWAIMIYGLIFATIMLWLRRLLLIRSRTKTALKIEKIEKEKVLELDRIKSRFFTNISHEIRTPLSLIIGPIENALRTEQATIELERKELELVSKHSRRLHQLIDQLLDISKLETGKVKLQVAEDDLEKFIRTIIMNFRSLAESRMIEYRYDLPVSKKLVWFDHDKMEKILVNLINNAFKFTGEGGQVNISMRYGPGNISADPEFVVLTVSDTGIGIAEENIAKIFDRFYQVNSNDTREIEGSGIGLALVKELVELCRGEISVESKYGSGTTFKVHLPVSKESFNEQEISSEFEENSREGTKVESPDILDEDKMSLENEVDFPELENDKPVVLIIEDNFDLREYISSNLEGDYQILTAKNGREGLERSELSIPDLVISDIMMPEMDGMEVCRRLKEGDKTSHIPVILLTAKAGHESKMEGLGKGADAYMAKPFDMKELQLRVKNLIEQRKKLRDQFAREFTDVFGKSGVVSSNDLLLNKIFQSVERHISDSEYNVERMAEELSLSKRQLFRKVNALTGFTPNVLIRNIRLKKAAHLFEAGEHNIARVMYEVGYNNQSYFSKIFRDLYQINPSEYIQKKSLK